MEAARTVLKDFGLSSQCIDDGTLEDCLEILATAGMDAGPFILEMLLIPDDHPKKDALLFSLQKVAAIGVDGEGEGESRAELAEPLSRSSQKPQKPPGPRLGTAIGQGLGQGQKQVQQWKQLDQFLGRSSSSVLVGTRVQLVQKHDQPTGRLTEGVVERVLTNSDRHPHGLKVMLRGGVVGRVKNVAASTTISASSSSYDPVSSSSSSSSALEKDYQYHPSPGLGIEFAIAGGGKKKNNRRGNKGRVKDINDATTTTSADSTCGSGGTTRSPTLFTCSEKTAVSVPAAVTGGGEGVKQEVLPPKAKGDDDSEWTPPVWACDDSGAGGAGAGTGTGARSETEEMEAISMAQSVLSSIPPEVVEYAYRVKCDREVEQTIDFFLDEVLSDGLMELLAMEAREWKTRIAREQADREVIKRNIVQRFDLQVALPKYDDKGKEMAKPAVPKLFTAPVSMGGGTTKTRFRDGVVVTQRGEKFVTEKKEEYDGGSRGKVMPKGKRGSGWVNG